METIEYKGYKINIEQDEYPFNPRKEFDNLGIMACFHSRYDLGDEQKIHGLDHKDFNGWEEMKKHILKEKKAVVIIDLYLYDHSGITMFMKGDGGYRQHESWDSGQVGFIYITAEKAREEYSKKRISKQLKAKLTEYLKGEVKTYDDYLTGNVYSYTVENADGKEIHSCSGYFGYDHEKSGLLESAKSEIDADIKHEDKKLHDIDAVS